MCVETLSLSLYPCLLRSFQRETKRENSLSLSPSLPSPIFSTLFHTVLPFLFVRRLSVSLFSSLSVLFSLCSLLFSLCSLFSLSLSLSLFRCSFSLFLYQEASSRVSMYEQTFIHFTHHYHYHRHIPLYLYIQIYVDRQICLYMSVF